MPKRPTEKSTLYRTPTGLRERGWTATLIERHLGPPDEYATNPHYRSGPKMRLYAIKRLEETEKKPAVSSALQKVLAARNRRSAAARKGVQTKRDTLKEWATTTPLS